NIVPAILLHSLRTSFSTSFHAPPHLHSFPTRRSSDLKIPGHPQPSGLRYSRRTCSKEPAGRKRAPPPLPPSPPLWESDQSPPYRSEEHTSELQSRFDLVCRLLLEKKKSYRQITKHYII